MVFFIRIVCCFFTSREANTHSLFVVLCDDGLTAQQNRSPTHCQLRTQSDIQYTNRTNRIWLFCRAYTYIGLFVGLTYREFVDSIEYRNEMSSLFSWVMPLLSVLAHNRIHVDACLPHVLFTHSVSIMPLIPYWNRLEFQSIRQCDCICVQWFHSHAALAWVLLYRWNFIRVCVLKSTQAYHTQVVKVCVYQSVGHYKKSHMIIIFMMYFELTHAEYSAINFFSEFVSNIRWTTILIQFQSILWSVW